MIARRVARVSPRLAGAEIGAMARPKPLPRLSTGLLFS
jgi:hypothetical protein